MQKPCKSAYNGGLRAPLEHLSKFFRILSSRGQGKRKDYQKMITELKSEQEIYWSNRLFEVQVAVNLFLNKIKNCDKKCTTCNETCDEYNEWSRLCNN